MPRERYDVTRTEKEERAENAARLASARKLAAMPEVTHHPLRLYLFARGVSLEEGARLLGLNLRTLKNVITYWSVPWTPQSRKLWEFTTANTIATALGIEEHLLFPSLDEAPPDVQEEVAKKRAERRVKLSAIPSPTGKRRPKRAR